ncbi:MAG: NAD(P)-dependent oxidoreductase [Oscillospiraceae bacterium]|nr:NAD(P)-dependent oxidoreductase [Oscillospiraceae bacterium]
MSAMAEWELEHDFLTVKNLLLPWKYLKNKCIFMTGATGLIGSYLARILCWLDGQLSLGLKLALLHRVGMGPVFSAPCARWVEGEMTEAFIPRELCPDIIIHAASPASGRAIASDPIGVVNCNVLAMQYLLERARKDHSMLVFFSSGEVYQRRPGRIAEKDAHELVQSGARPFYGNSKLAGELLCEGYREKYGVDCRILRPFSIFGPGEPLTSGRCFTDFTRQALNAHKIRVDGPGSQIRSYCYLSDFVSGLFYVLLCGESTVYNIGNEDNTCSILELARQMASIYGNTDVIEPVSADILSDSFVPDTTRIRQLGWRPQVNLQDCIKRCMDSYR